jgi:hypothetical protein
MDKANLIEFYTLKPWKLIYSILSQVISLAEGLRYNFVPLSPRANGPGCLKADADQGIVEVIKKS